MWAFAAISPVAAAAQSIGWRGDGTGHFAAAKPPLKWSETQNVRWSTALPAPGNASPIVVGERVFVTAEPTTLIAIDRKSGRILWQRDNSLLETLDAPERARIEPLLAQVPALEAELKASLEALDGLRRRARSGALDPAIPKQLAEVEARAGEQRAQLDQLSLFTTPADKDIIGYASPTPVSDGERVIAFFGNGVLAAYGLDGKRQWIRGLGPQPPDMNGYHQGHAASPVLAGGVVAVGFRQLQAFDAKTGAPLWQEGDYRDYGSPALVQAGGAPAVVTPAGDLYRLRDGAMMAGHMSSIWYAGPLAFGNTVYFLGSGQELESRGWSRAQAIALPTAPVEPREFKATTRWHHQIGGARYYASALRVDGLLYAVTRRGRLEIFSAETGQRVHDQPLAAGVKAFATWYPSLAYAGGYIFASDEGGRTVVLSPGTAQAPAPRVVEDNRLEAMRATPFFAGDAIFIRGLEKLWCIGQK